MQFDLCIEMKEHGQSSARFPPSSWGISLCLAVTLTTTTITGCAVSDASPDSTSGSTAREQIRQTRQKMVGGTVSSAAQDATVMLVHGDESCSGSLIAENLVLTARHCVATPVESQTTDCVPYGANVAPSSIQVKVGVSATFESPAVAALGQRIFVPATSNMCSFDVALLQLDRPITSVKIAPVRFSDLAANEQTVAVGYGVDGNDQELPNRMQRTTNVLGVGPKTINYATKQNTTLTYNLPQGDVATGESTCFGDSGGPLFDMQGRVVAITSRGINDGGEQGHGNTCIDEPSIYAGVKFNEALIREAAQAAGHPLPVGDAPPPGSPGKRGGGTTTPQSSDDEDNSADDNDATNSGESSSGDDDPKPKKKPSGYVQPAAGCSTAPGRAPTNGGSMIAIVIAAALIGARSRRSRRA